MKTIYYVIVAMVLAMMCTTCTWWGLKQYDHFYNDHVALHQLIQIEIQRQQQSHGIPAGPTH